MNKFQQRMLDAALAYASMGWAVLPTSKKTKRPLISGGSLSATTDADTIKRWWEEFPSANIGIATGKISGIWVVDIDIKDGKNGAKSIASEYEDTYTIERDQLKQKTTSGGVHLVFECPDDYEIRNKTGVLEGVDIRGEGGYIIAAPSAMYVDNEWKEYQWNSLENKVYKAPEWALDLSKRRGGETNSSGQLDVLRVVSGLDQTTRDTGLFKFACLLRQRDIPIDLALAFVSEAANRCSPPFEQAVAQEKVEQAYRYNTGKQSEREQNKKKQLTSLEQEIERLKGQLGE